MIRLMHPLPFVLLALSSLAWPKDEILPTKQKPRDRQGPENPLHNIADDMSAVARWLKEAMTGDTTQDTQQKIIEKLEKLIEAARQQSEKQPQGGQGDSQKQQKKPEPQPASQQQKEQETKQQQKPASAQEQEQKQQRPGLGRRGTDGPPGALHTDSKEWGDLPPAIRDQLLQTQGEGFPLKYRELLRRYYRELAKPRE